MTEKISARETALSVLTACRTSSAWADSALKARIERDALSGQDAALATRIVYGVLQNQLLLEFYLTAYCSQALNNLQSPLADILRLGAYQILYLDKVPDSAAVNEAVKLAKLSGRGQASGLVNAVLRKVAQNKNALPPVPKTDDLSFLSITYSHPKWLVERLLSLLGREEAEAFLRKNNEDAPLTVQVNSLKTTAEALIEELTAAGISSRPHPWVSGCLELTGAGKLTALPAFQNGLFFVQDAAAKLVTEAASIKPGGRMIDVCAAPGGKSFSAAIAMGNEGDILSCDLLPNKLRSIEEGAARLGLTCIRTAAADGREEQPDWVESADTVLVDAPCSGLGIIRKKPDIRYKKPDALLLLPVIQSAILKNAAAYVKPGGNLIYSTCSILPEENEQITDAFLAGHPDFSREGFSLPAPADGTQGQITLWPQRHGTDGFYICRMKRRT